MLLTGHWSVTDPHGGFIGDYHAQYRQVTAIPRDDVLALGQITNIADMDFEKLLARFEVKKVIDFDVASQYATWHINHDPRDNSPDVAVASISMGADAANHVPGASTNGNFGSFPFDFSHAWMMAAVMARIAYLKEIDLSSSFATDVEPSVLQNGPIFACSTHGERALQTVDSQDSVPQLGYFLYSGDGDCRWDLAVLDPSQCGSLSTTQSAIDRCKQSATWLRTMAHAHKVMLNDKSDFLGLDKAV